MKIKKLLLLSSLFLLQEITVSAQCGWIDGPDNRIPQDAGRGILRWTDHNNYALQPNIDINTCAMFIGERLNSLSRCLLLDDYARCYADVSVRIANFLYTVPPGSNGGYNNLAIDGGYMNSDWNAHYSYVKSYGPGNSASLVQSRMNYLAYSVSRPDYALLYADVSVIIAKYGTYNNVPPPTGYTSTPAVQSTTTTTTTTGNPNNVNVNMNLGGLGFGMNVNVNEQPMQTGTVTQQTTTTVVTETAPQQTVIVQTVPVVQPGPCFVSDGEYAQIDGAIRSKPFPETKMSTAELALKNKCLSINQIKSLTALFAFPEDKLHFLKYAYNYTNDHSNYYTLSSCLTFDDDIENFNAFLSNAH